MTMSLFRSPPIVVEVSGEDTLLLLVQSHLNLPYLRYLPTYLTLPNLKVSVINSRGKSYRCPSFLLYCSSPSTLVTTASIKRFSFLNGLDTTTFLLHTLQREIRIVSSTLHRSIFKASGKHFTHCMLYACKQYCHLSLLAVDSCVETNLTTA